MRQHIRQKHQDAPVESLKCNLCSDTFTSIRALRSHELAQHKGGDMGSHSFFVHWNDYEALNV